jgi:hypothetical protein
LVVSGGTKSARPGQVLITDLPLYYAEMTETESGLHPVQQARTQALIAPREHGAWGLLLIPLFTGIATTIASAQTRWPLLVFAAAAILLFGLRTPIESLVGLGPLVARSPRERLIALIASFVLAVSPVALLTVLMWRGRYPKLLLFGATAAGSFVAQAVLRKVGREMRMTSQLAGAVGLTSTAPAAYYLGTGTVDAHALALWAANWLFTWDQIHFVQLRIHTARAATRKERFARARSFILIQILVLAVSILMWFRRIASPLVILAFLPVLIRGSRWFFRRPEPLDIKKLGWSEVTQGIVFGILLVLAFVVSR